MTRIAASEVNNLDYIAEDISNAKRTVCAASNGQKIDPAQFMLACRQLERAAEYLAEHREMFYIEMPMGRVVRITGKARKVRKLAA